jgi:tetratricopeptide (TPR) repeat protein
MRKRHRHRQLNRPSPATAQPPTDIPPGDWRARVESLLAGGRTREAVETAKQFLKGTPGPEAEALLVLAYEARIRALMADGMYTEAQVLAGFVVERFRAHRDRITPLLRQSQLLSVKNFDLLLTELAAADPPRRRELEAVLARELTDPAPLADSPILSPDDPLRRAARTVSGLFAAVTSGPLPPDALGGLDAIPRHSPLAPWKLLIRALDAFYRRADAVALANLSAIPVPSGPGRLVPVLRRLLGEVPPTEARSPAVASLLDKVSGGRAALQAHLPRLSRALAAQDGKATMAAIQDILSLLPALPAALRQLWLATILHHWIRRDSNPEVLTRALLRSTRDPDAPRLLALALERTGVWEGALSLWDSYLSTMIRSGVWPASCPEVSRVLLHMAALFPPDFREVLESFGAGSEQELRSLIAARALPAFLDRGALLERARAADPDPRVFRALVAHYQQGEPKRAVAEAEAWRRAHPRDLEPLLYLLRAAEGRGALRKALGLLADAEAIDGVHPEVRQSRFRLLLASAERRLGEHKYALATTDLDRLEREPRAAEGDHLAYLLALRWVTARWRGDTGAATAVEQTLGERLGNPVAGDLILGGVARLFGTQPPRTAGAAAQPQAIDGLARACDLFRSVNRPLTVARELVAQVERDLTGASIAQLHALAVGGLWIGSPSLSHAASGRGLAHDGPLLHRFLLARGRVLATVLPPRDRDRARQCLRAARELAARTRDMDAVREASAALQASGGVDPWMDPMPARDDAPPTQEEIQRILAAERGRDAPPGTPDTPRRRPRRPRQPRRQEFLQSLLPFLEDLP